MTSPMKESLKRIIRAKENELSYLKQSVQRKESDYNIVKYNFALSWYGKNELQKAKNHYEFVEKELKQLKARLERLEKD